MRHPTTRDLSDRHEARLAAALGGRATRASGSTFRDQADGRHPHGSRSYVFAWDGKATLGQSIAVSRAMWAKIKEQAHGARPMVALCFYADERLTRVEASLVAVGEDDFVEMMEAAEDRQRLRRDLRALAKWHAENGGCPRPEDLLALIGEV